MCPGTEAGEDIHIEEGRSSGGGGSSMNCIPLRGVAETVALPSDVESEEGACKNRMTKSPDSGVAMGDEGR